MTGGFTCLDVDAQVMGPDGSLYDVLFVGTKEGKNVKEIVYTETGFYVLVNIIDFKGKINILR